MKEDGTDVVIHHTTWNFAHNGDYFSVLVRHGQVSGAAKIYVDRERVISFRKRERDDGISYDFKLIGKSSLVSDAQVIIVRDKDISPAFLYELRVNGLLMLPTSEEMWPATSVSPASPRERCTSPQSSLQRSALVAAHELAYSRVVAVDKVHGDVGITLCNRVSAHSCVRGVLVQGLQSDGTALKAGLQIGDLVLRVNSIKVSTHQHAIQETDAPCDEIKYRVWGRHASVEERMTFPDGDLGLHLSLHAGPGVLVTSIEPAGTAAQAGLVLGSIILSIEGIIVVDPVETIRRLPTRASTTVVVHQPPERIEHRSASSQPMEVEQLTDAKLGDLEA